MSHTIGNAYFRSEKVAIGIFHFQIWITGNASCKGIVMTGRKLLVVGYLSYDARQILRIKTCTYTDSSGFVGFQHEYQVIRFLVRLSVFYTRKDIQSPEHGKCAIYLLRTDFRIFP